MKDELPPLPKLELGIYEHRNGNHYEVIGIARHSETLEPLVVYRALYGEGAIWVRPFEIFLEKIKLPDGSEVERFKKI